MNKNKTYIKGKHTEYLDVEIEITELLEQLKREIYRPLGINFTAFVDEKSEIKIVEDDCRNGYDIKPYKVTFEQKKLIKAFDLVKKHLYKILTKTS